MLSCCCLVYLHWLTEKSFILQKIELYKTLIIFCISLKQNRKIVKDKLHKNWSEIGRKSAICCGIFVEKYYFKNSRFPISKRKSPNLNLAISTFSKIGCLENFTESVGDFWKIRKKILPSFENQMQQLQRQQKVQPFIIRSRSKSSIIAGERTLLLVRLPVVLVSP